MNLKTKMILSVGAVLLVVLCGAFIFVFNSQKSQHESLYYSQAKAVNETLSLVRTVVSGHGGVFAKQTEDFGVNPYLKQVVGEKAEMKNAKGEKLALINGFSLIQEMSDVSRKKGVGSFTYRAPSDKALNPVNKATAEEVEVLNKMRNEGIKESYSKVTDKNGNTTYVYNAAMVNDEPCMNCHLDYKKGGVDGMMSISLPITAAEARANQDLQNLVYIFLGALAIVMGVVYWLASRITKPIKELADAADRISMGETDVNIDFKRNDEIGELAEAFNRMSASIKILTMTEEELPKTGSDA